ncbi:MAG: gamma-glutamylcyclotransferase [Proteobacteria bacterium]|nr:gamma-glutamylcyclotransferase [Pseudomonadota bacterium]
MVAGPRASFVPAAGRLSVARAARRPFFFYGTLADADVLARVAGERPARAGLKPGVLDGYRRVAVARRDYPTLVPAAGGGASRASWLRG